MSPSDPWRDLGGHRHDDDLDDHDDHRRPTRWRPDFTYRPPAPMTAEARARAREGIARCRAALARARTP